MSQFSRWLFNLLRRESANRARAAARSLPPRPVRLALECLEDRITPNSTPILTPIDDHWNREGNLVQFFAEATDADEDPLTYSATGLPPGISINSSTGEISGTVNFEAAGEEDYEVTVYATDPSQAFGSGSFSWTINNFPLIGAIDDRTSPVGSAVAFQVPYVTPNGLTPSFSASGLPEGLSIDENNGLITGTLEEIDSFEVTIELDTGNGVDERSFTWNVTSAPSVTAPASQAVAEGEEVIFSVANENAIVVADSGPSEISLTITLTAQNGTMTLAQTTGLSFSIGDGSEDETMTFSGEAADINDALDGLGYTLTEDAGGFDLIAITVVETGAIGPEPVSASIIITPGGPKVEVPDAQSTDLGDPLVFSVANENAIVVGDSGPSDTELTVTISVMYGTLTLAQTTGLTFDEGDGAADETMTFTGEAADINDALDGLEYALTANVDGLDTLRITVDDPFSLEENAPQAVGEVDIASGPAVSVPGAQALQPGEDLVFALIHGNAITVGDSQGSATELTVTISVGDGTLTLTQTTGLTFDTGDGTDDATMTFTGVAEDINAALDGLAYEKGGGFDVADVLSITVDNETTLLEEENQASASVDIVEGPTLVVPDEQTTPIDTALEFSVAEENAISVAASGPSNAELTVTMTATNGTITLAQTTGLTFDEGDGTADETMTFAGEAEDINAALDGLLFTPETSYEGDATLSIGVSENLGTPDIDVTTGATIDIFVGEASTVPSVAAPYMQATDPETTLVFSSGNDNAITVSDTGPSNTILTVELAAEHGILTLASTTGITFTLIGMNGSNWLRFTGTAANINNALNGLSYEPGTAFEGTDTLIITVDDPDTIENEEGQAVHTVGIVVEEDVGPGMLFLTVALDDIETECVTINIDLADVVETIAEADELIRALESADGAPLASMIQSYYTAHSSTESAFDEVTFDAMTAMAVDFLEGVLSAAEDSSWQFQISATDADMGSYSVDVRPPAHGPNSVTSVLNEAPFALPNTTPLPDLHAHFLRLISPTSSQFAKDVAASVLTSDIGTVEWHLTIMSATVLPKNSTIPPLVQAIVASLIDGLGSLDFSTRRDSQSQLVNILEAYKDYPVSSMLISALQTTTDAETELRLTKILTEAEVFKSALKPYGPDSDNSNTLGSWEFEAIKRFSSRTRALQIFWSIGSNPGFAWDVRKDALRYYVDELVSGLLP